MKIIFYHPTSASAEPEPPLGIGYLCAIADELMFETEIYDHDHAVHHETLEGLISKFKPDIFAISCMTPQYFHAQRIIRQIRSMLPSCIIVIGGPHPSALPVETMKENPGLDYLFKGEGERSFKEFLIAIRDGIPIPSASIDGVYFRNEQGEIVEPPQVTLLTNEELNALPLPAWNRLLKYGMYHGTLNYTGKPVLVFPIITARGCPYECTFCDERSIWQRKVRTRTIDNVVAEISFLMQQYRAVHINILDDTFTLKSSRVEEFCDKVCEKKIQFRITAKVNTVNADILGRLKRAGCMMVGYGVESGDEAVLKTMKKRQTLEQVRTAFQLTNAAGIQSYALCMVGNIGEDFEAVRKTAAFVKEINAHLFSVAIMTPYPGSENYRICEQNNWILTKDWSKWCPTPVRVKGWEPVSRTDKMDREAMIRSYYFLIRAFMLHKFQRRYGVLFFVNPNFYITEILNRVRMVGAGSMLNHIKNLVSK